MLSSWGIQKRRMFTGGILSVTGSACSIRTNNIAAEQAIRKSQGRYSWDKLIKINGLNVFANAPDKKMIEYANKILQGHMIVNEHFGGDSPVFSINSVDWGIQFAKSPNTFQLYLQGLGPVQALLTEYQLTENSKYLTAAIKLVESWNQYRGSPEAKGNPYVWNDHGAAFILSNTDKATNQRVVLAISAVGILSALFAFKYVNFSLEQVSVLSNLFGHPVKFEKVKWALPVGISFYSFMALGYLFDVCRGKIKATKHLGKYALFISFFPHIAQGPIDRAALLLPQFDEAHKFDYELVKKGLLLILWGAFKKRVIADRLAMLVDTVFNNVSAYSGQAFWIASVFYTFQIYCDFSGYTDMAMGSANIMGFRLYPNFKFPYLATSVTDFWRRLAYFPDQLVS